MHFVMCEELLFFCFFFNSCGWNSLSICIAGAVTFTVSTSYPHGI